VSGSVGEKREEMERRGTQIFKLRVGVIVGARNYICMKNNIDFHKNLLDKWPQIS